MYNIDIDIEKFTKIVLQFPPNELAIAVDICKSLQEKYGDKQFYILSDHLHSSCCVDVIGAKHIDHDLIIHFGYACFSEKMEKHIKYIFPLQQYDKHYVEEQILEIEDYYILADQQFDISTIKLNDNILLKNQSQDLNEQYQLRGCGYYSSQIKDKLFFIGSEDSQLLERFIMHYNIGHFKSIIVCNPINKYTQKFERNYMTQLLKRNKQVEDAIKCERFGLLINNASAQYTQRVWHQCRKLLKENGKKYYTFSMNQLTEAKLGNFPEIECYIVISCFKQCIIDTKEYYKLIITPFQLLQVFSQVEYKIDSDLSIFNILNEQKVEYDKQDKQVENRLIFNEGQVVPLNQIFQSLEFYSDRKYKGLELRKDLPPAKLEQGLSGIASKYQTES